MNVCLMWQSISGSHLCVEKCVLSGQSIPGVAISTSGNTSVMSASGLVRAAVDGSWSHDWRVCPHVASPQPCRNTGCETDVLTASTPAFVMLERDTTVHGAKRYTHSQ